jgi:hypothetical protein
MIFTPKIMTKSKPDRPQLPNVRRATDVHAVANSHRQKA